MTATNTPSPRPVVRLDLKGPGGNAFAVLGTVTEALRDAGYPEDAIKAFQTEAKAGDYEHLLEVVRQWVEVKP